MNHCYCLFWYITEYTSIEKRKKQKCTSENSTCRRLVNENKIKAQINSCFFLLFLVLQQKNLLWLTGVPCSFFVKESLCNISVYIKGQEVM